MKKLGLQINSAVMVEQEPRTPMYKPVVPFTAFYIGKKGRGRIGMKKTAFVFIVSILLLLNGGLLIGLGPTFVKKSHVEFTVYAFGGLLVLGGLGMHLIPKGFEAQKGERAIRVRPFFGRWEKIYIMHIASIQIIRKMVGTRKTGYELNIVLRDGSRRNILDNNNLDVILHSAELLRRVTQVTVNDYTLSKTR